MGIYKNTVTILLFIYICYPALAHTPLNCENSFGRSRYLNKLPTKGIDLNIDKAKHIEKDLSDSNILKIKKEIHSYRKHIETNKSPYHFLHLFHLYTLHKKSFDTYGEIYNDSIIKDFHKYYIESLRIKKWFSSNVNENFNNFKLIEFVELAKLSTELDISSRLKNQNFRESLIGTFGELFLRPNSKDIISGQRTFVNSNAYVDYWRTEKLEDGSWYVRNFYEIKTVKDRVSAVKHQINKFFIRLFTTEQLELIFDFENVSSDKLFFETRFGKMSYQQLKDSLIKMDNDVMAWRKVYFTADFVQLIKTSKSKRNPNDIYYHDFHYTVNTSIQYPHVIKALKRLLFDSKSLTINSQYF